MGGIRYTLEQRVQMYLESLAGRYKPFSMYQYCTVCHREYPRQAFRMKFLSQTSSERVTSLVCSHCVTQMKAHKSPKVFPYQYPIEVARLREWVAQQMSDAKTRWTTSLRDSVKATLAKQKLDAEVMATTRNPALLGKAKPKERQCSKCHKLFTVEGTRYRSWCGACTYMYNHKYRDRKSSEGA